MPNDYEGSNHEFLKMYSLSWKHCIWFISTLAYSKTQVENRLTFATVVVP